MEYRNLCSSCVFRSLCINNNIKGCPCKKCLIKMMCRNVCEEADIFFIEAHRHRNELKSN